MKIDVSRLAHSAVVIAMTILLSPIMLIGMAYCICDIHFRFGYWIIDKWYEGVTKKACRKEDIDRVCKSIDKEKP